MTPVFEFSTNLVLIEVISASGNIYVTLSFLLNSQTKRFDSFLLQ